MASSLPSSFTFRANSSPVIAEKLEERLIVRAVEIVLAKRAGVVRFRFVDHAFERNQADELILCAARLLNR